MGVVPKESSGQLLFAFCQEFFGSLFMYLLFFPVGAMLGNTIEGWIFHFLAVICFDILTFGSCANPMICVALFLSGKLTFIGTVIRVAAELLVGLVAFSLLHAIVPEKLIDLTGGPEMSAGFGIYYGCIVEGLISFVFALTVLLASSFVPDPEFSRPLFATTLRLLIEFAAPITGGNMNTMVGFSWAFYTNRMYSQDYQMIYTLSPLLGGAAAAGVYCLLMTQFPSEKEVIVSERKVTKKKRPESIRKTEPNGVDELKKVVALESPKKEMKTPTKVPKKAPEARSVTRSQTTGPNLRKKSVKLNFD